MAIEFQIRAQRFADIVKTNLQSQLRHTCLSPAPDLLIDHLDLAADPARLSMADGAVHIEVAVNVFVVTRDAVLAAPNGRPGGADTPAAKMWIDLTFSVTGNALQFACVGATSEPPNPAIDPVLGPMMAGALPTRTAMDLTPLRNQFGVGGGAASVSLGSEVVTVRLAGTGPTASYLQGDQEWGMFIDQGFLRSQAEAKLRPQLEKKLTGVRITSTWTPQGTTPRLESSFQGNIPLPDPFPAGELTGRFVSSWSLVTMYLRVLQTAVAWEIGVDLGALVPAAFDALVRGIVADELNKPSPDKTITGPRSFTTDQWLPEIALGSSRLLYGSVLASAEGMTIGGSVRLPSKVGSDTVSLSITPFGKPFRVTVCSLLAKSGSGDPPPIVRPSEVAANAEAWLENCGHLCGVEIVSPGEWLRPYIFPQRPPEDDTQQISLVIPSLRALAITEPVRLLVHTTRGQRLLQWAAPPPVEIVDGKVVNATTSHIDDCLKLPPGWDDISEIRWGQDEALVNPEYGVDWMTHVEQESIIAVQVVTIDDLQAGEILVSRSPTHSIVVTANPDGVAIVPIFLGVRDGVARGTVTSLRGTDLVRHGSIQSAVFTRQAVFASTLEAGVQRQMLGSQLGGKTSVTAFARPRNPLPGDIPGYVRMYLPTVREVYDIPGFPDLPLKVAGMADGRKVLVDAGAKDGPQVVGTFEGPIGHLDHEAGWASAARADGLVMFGMARSEESPILAQASRDGRTPGLR